MKSRLLSACLVLALAVLPGCGPAKDAAQRGVVRILGAAVAGMLFGNEASTADPTVEAEPAPEGQAAASDDDGGWLGGDDEPADPSRPAGFYKVVDANGTIRFVTSLDEVPANQRSDAERLAMERSGDPDRPPRRAAAKPAAKQLAAAKNSAAVAAPPTSGSQ